MFITFEMYEKMLNEDKKIDNYVPKEVRHQFKKDLMESYSIYKEEDLVPLLLDFEINRICNIFRNKNMDFLRTFFTLSQSVETMFAILEQEPWNCVDMIICGLYDIIFYKCKLFETYEDLKQWCDEKIMLYNEREKEENPDGDYYEKSNVPDNVIVDAMLDFIKMKYENIL